ncbi:MAG TPA: D-aminoacylase [Candidatus Bathyarchaeia archaeon]|nr:D-aminoacylase [Candidatus Bathyarchaeia archaeon]
MAFETLIKNGVIVDGTGNPWFKADIGIAQGKIAELGQLSDSKAERVIDARGLVVSPGFIDIHTHSDLSLLINPRAESKIRQGVTTEVIGNCGTSPAPLRREKLRFLKDEWGAEAKAVKWNWSTFGDYLHRLEEQGVSLNVASLVGHGAVRTAVMGVENRSPKRKEMNEMKQLVAQSMKEGAFGLSSGLVYLPGCFAKTSELIELCKVVAGYGGFYASHTRGERETIVDALKEVIQIGEKAKVPVQVSHNCPKYGGHGKFKEMSKLYEDARTRGIELTIDNDAHSDLGPQLSSVLPQWAQAGGSGKIVERLKDHKTRKRIKKEIVADKFPGPGYCGLVKHGQWGRIFLFTAKKNKQLVGNSFDNIARLRGTDPFDAYFDVLVEEKGEASAIFNYIDEDDIRAVLKHPLMMICSDGSAVAPYGVLSRISGYYPCSYGEYPYILERFVREEGVLTLQEAIRKMTSFPAQKLGLFDRGLIRVGMCADIVVFNPDTMKDRATCRFPYHFPLPNYPHKYPEGIEYVMVSGEIVVARGRHLGALPGRVLRHTTR